MKTSLQIVLGFGLVAIAGIAATMIHAARSSSKSTSSGPEPHPRPPPPSVVEVPAGWARLPDVAVTPALTAFANIVLAQEQPIGDVQTALIDGESFGALTEWHWDDHVDHTWKWHRGVSLLRKEP